MKTPHTDRHQYRDNHFWQSFTDLMAALLFIFVLALIVTILRLDLLSKEALENAATAESQANEALATAESISNALNEQGAELERILGIRQSLIEALRKEFQEDELSVDPQTGAIVFKADLMFDFKDTELNSEYKDTLRIFIKKYIDVLLSEEFAPYVAEIVIEGHTDSIGSYENNLWFSQQRALSVATFILSEKEHIFSKKDLAELRKLVSINGRSESELILVNGKEDAAASRRVEIQFRLKDEEMIQKMIDAIS